jgi:two-component system, OmpR family, sensor histidine kinase AdeS
MKMAVLNKLSSLSLRAQLLVAMLISVVLTIGTTVTISYFLSLWITNKFEKGLSTAGLKVSKQINAYIIPTDISAVREYFEKSKILTENLDKYSIFVYLGFALTAMLVVSAIAIFIATHMARQLQNVSVAVQSIAKGELSTRARLSTGAAGEVQNFVHNFNSMAESLETYQRQFVENSAGIAHELRTPLTILRGRLQGMLVGIFKIDTPNVEALISQVDSLTQIVNDLRVTSLASAGKFNVALEPIKLEEEIAALVQGLKPDIATALMKVELDLRPVTVCGDPNRLRQATLALIDNVMQHASSGKIISVATGLSDGNAYIRVMDRGAGLPQNADRLFEPFWRQDGSRSRETGGSGLGLSVAAAIAKAHKGSIVARNRPSGGAVFEILIPCPEPMATK